MSKQRNQGYTEASDITRLRFNTSRNRVDLIVDPEWTSVLRPSINDRLELALSDQYPNALLVFIDQRWQGRHSWKRYGKQGALMASFHCRSVFEWCRDLLPEQFDYVPTVFDLFRDHPGVRGITLNWPSWTEVMLSNVLTQASRTILQQRCETLGFQPQLFVEAFMDGKRIIF